MLKINRKVEYALIALKHMGRKTPGQLTSAKEVCDTYRTPFDPTSRVLQIMTQNEILQAEQGAHGGYQILRDLSKVTLKEICESIIGPLEIVSCFHEKNTQCDLMDCCCVIDSFRNLNSRISELFQTITIAELLGLKNVEEKLEKK